MKHKQHSTEEIIRMLRQAETDETIDSVCREHNVSKATFHRWKRKYSDMDLADAKQLEKENAEPKKMLAESLLKHRVLEEVNAKKWYARCRRNKLLLMSLAMGCARCVGPVTTWACIDRPIGIGISPWHQNRSSYISGLWPYPGNILGMATGAVVRC